MVDKESKFEEAWGLERVAIEGALAFEGYLENLRKNPDPFTGRRRVLRILGATLGGLAVGGAAYGYAVVNKRSLAADYLRGVVGSEQAGPLKLKDYTQGAISEGEAAIFSGGALINNIPSLTLKANGEVMAKLLTAPEARINLPDNFLTIVGILDLLGTEVDPTLQQPKFLLEMALYRNTSEAEILRLRARYEGSRFEPLWTGIPFGHTLNNIERENPGIVGGVGPVSREGLEILGLWLSFEWAQGTRSAYDNYSGLVSQSVGANARRFITAARPITVESYSAR